MSSPTTTTADPNYVANMAILERHLDHLRTDALQQGQHAVATIYTYLSQRALGNRRLRMLLVRKLLGTLTPEETPEEYREFCEYFNQTAQWIQEGIEMAREQRRRTAREAVQTAQATTAGSADVNGSAADMEARREP